jgi:hypothetical protein
MEILGYELKCHHSGFDKKCVNFSDQKKRAKFQWLQHLSQINKAIRKM